MSIMYSVTLLTTKLLLALYQRSIFGKALRKRLAR